MSGLGMTVWKKLKKGLRNFDAFGVYLNFQYKNNKQYQSAVGGFVYLFFIALALIYLLINFRDFVSRSNFTLVYNEGVNFVAPNISFTKMKIGVAVGLRTDDWNFTKSLYKYFDIGFGGVILKKENGVVKKSRVKMNLLPCTYDNFYNNSNDLFDQLDLSNYFCPTIDDFEVQGIYTEDLFKYMEFYVQINPNYYNATDMFKKLFEANEIKAEVYYLDSSIFAYDYQKPIRQFLNSQFNYLDFRLYKKTNLDFSEWIFASDDNLIIPNDEEERVFSLGGVSDFFTDIGEDRLIKKTRDFNALTKMYIRSTTSFTQLRRVYMKVPQYLADMSGLLSFIMIILFFVMNSINTFKAEQSIINKIFKFKEDLSNKNIEKINYLKEKFEILRDGKILHFIFLIFLDNKFNFDSASKSGSFAKKYPNQTINGISVKSISELRLDRAKIEDFNEVENEIFKTDKANVSPRPNNELNLETRKRLHSSKTFILVPNKQKTISINEETSPEDKKAKKVEMYFSCWEIVVRSVCFCCPLKKIKKKSLLLDKGNEKFNYQMNVMTYMRKMQELDILKYVLLSSDQITLLNFVSKPSVSLVSNNELIEALYKIFNVEINKEEVDKLSEAVLNITGADNTSQLDRKLVDLVNSEIENLVIE